MRAVGRLLRLSLLPSAVADVTVGLALGSGGAWIDGAAPWLLILSSLGVYHGAMALNDWADREADRRTRPDRPIPSGAVGAGQALGLGLGLVAAGIGCAYAAAPIAGAWMAVVGVLAVGYDLVGRGPWLGPALLALCRFGNFGAGLLAPGWILGGRAAGLAQVLAPAILYGAYVFFVSRLGRLEDDEDAGPLGDRPRHHLLSASACLVAIPLVGAWWLAGDDGAAQGIGASLVVAVAGVYGLLRTAFGTSEWTREIVGRTMGMALRRLLVFTAACALIGVTWGWAPRVAAAFALAGYPLSYGLRRVFPPS